MLIARNNVRFAMKRAVCKNDGSGLPFRHSRERGNPEGPNR
jgi:hypothetical protein